jgi:hypothetical protein
MAGADEDVGHFAEDGGLVIGTCLDDFGKRTGKLLVRAMPRAREVMQWARRAGLKPGEFVLWLNEVDDAPDAPEVKVIALGGAEKYAKKHDWAAAFLEPTESGHVKVVMSVGGGDWMVDDYPLDMFEQRLCPRCAARAHKGGVC